MKTSERILFTALSLFNERGENGVTSVDIAIELDISPGNLYYHFKGKEVIVEKLLALHKQQMMSLLQEGVVEKMSAQDLFYYLYMVVEKLHLFRFLYRSPADLAEKYSHAHRLHKQVLSALEKQNTGILKQLIKQKQMILGNAEVPILSELITLILTQSVQYDQLQDRMSEEGQKYHCLSLLMVCLLPRLQLSVSEITHIQAGIASHNLANLNPDNRDEETA